MIHGVEKIILWQEIYHAILPMFSVCVNVCVCAHNKSPSSGSHALWLASDVIITPCLMTVGCVVLSLNSDVLGNMHKMAP